MNTADRSPETHHMDGVTTWLTLIDTGHDNDAVSHASAQCPRFAEALAAGHDLQTETNATGWLCGYCADVETAATLAQPHIQGPSVDAPAGGAGKARQAAPIEDAEPATDAEVHVLLTGLGRKIEVHEVTGALRAWATVWARKYDGTFEFMVDMKAAAAKRTLSPAQAKGTLNCAAAAIRRGEANAPQGAPAPVGACDCDDHPGKTHAEAQASNQANPVTEDGMYRTPEGVIYKVQIAHHGSGNLYAKRLVVEGSEGSFEYEAGAIRKLRAGWRMTLDEAKAFGRLYGVCCNCAAVLTDEHSIAEGIGPVCAKRF